MEDLKTPKGHFPMKLPLEGLGQQFQWQIFFISTKKHKNVAHGKTNHKNAQNIIKFSPTQKLPFQTILFPYKLCVKVKIFWEGHKNLKESPSLFDVT